MTIDPWAKVESTDAERELIYRKPRTFAQDVISRFARKPTALGGLAVVILLLLFALAGPLFTPFDYQKQTLTLANIPPIFHTTLAPDEDRAFYRTTSMKVMELDASGRLIRQLPKVTDDYAASLISFQYSEDSLIYIDYSVNPPVLLDADSTPLPAGGIKWNLTYPLGTDHLGRDILTRLMYGTRISLMVAFIAATVNLIIGALYGGVAGYLGGRVDSILMRIVDIISTIPLTLYVILIKVVLGNGLMSIIIALSSVYWVDMARVVRGQALTLKRQDFVQAARTMGTRTRALLISHILPNAMGPILVTVTMLIPSAIFMEAFMSFIGIGIAPPMASLGTMCNDATEALRQNPYQLFLPALVICLTMFAFNFVGDGLRDALDPKLKR
ncbi:MAG: ABC transporter permease [Oscillospiraceae bacterium]|nr:ABC transporter permease [Oscillospiraceae bacterium]